MDRSGRTTVNRLLAASSAALAAVYAAGLPAVSTPPVFLWLPVVSIAATAGNSSAASPAAVWKDGTWSGFDPTCAMSLGHHRTGRPV
jgi:hypothetical protein